MNWDSSTMWIVIGVVALLALYFYNRSRPVPRGTYDDKHTRSSGSIGGGSRAYDDPAQRSSGSIGGGDRAYDTPEHESRGSIGGGTGGGPVSPPTTSHVNRTHTADRDRDLVRGIDRTSPSERLADERTQQSNTATHNRVSDERQPDDERFRSKGSIGG